MIQILIDIYLCLSCLAACINGYLVKRISQYKTAWLGSFSMLLGYLIVLFAVPFPVMCVFMVFVGYGIGLTQSSSNVVCGEMPKGTLMLCLLHGKCTLVNSKLPFNDAKVKQLISYHIHIAFYAAGGLIGPLMASGLLESNKPWNTSYMILCGLAGFNCVSIFLCFRKLRIRAEREADAAEQEAMLRRSSPEEPSSEATSTTVTIDEEKQEVTKKTSQNILLQTIRYRINYVGAVFLLFYTGTEVTVGNWGYTFLISTRSSDTVAMAHIMSGYWAGICAGRLFLGVVTHHFGEKRMIYCYLSIIVGMMVLLWLVPYVGANAAALVITGIALGPIFPTTVSVANKLIPSGLYASSVGVLSAVSKSEGNIFVCCDGEIDKSDLIFFLHHLVWKRRFRSFPLHHWCPHWIPRCTSHAPILRCHIFLYAYRMVLYPRSKSSSTNSQAIYQ